jgi:hypothetical protein
MYAVLLKDLMYTLVPFESPDRPAVIVNVCEPKAGVIEVADLTSNNGVQVADRSPSGTLLAVTLPL